MNRCIRKHEGTFRASQRGGTLLLALLIGCAPAAPTPAQPKTVVRNPKAPEPRVEVRSIFEGRSDVRLPSTEVALPGVGILQAGDNGRRSILGADGSTKTAETIAASRLVGMLRDDGQRFVFVGAHGDAYVAETPLGSFVEKREGPTVDAESETAVGEALVVREHGGKLHRSTDLGKTWSPLTIPTGPVARIVAVAAHRDGSLFALAHPQRVLHSTDGATTWTRVSSGGAGAFDMMKDPAGDVWVWSSDQKFARYDLKANAFLPGGTPMAAMAKMLEGLAERSSMPFRRRTLVGERIVEVDEVEGGVRVELATVASRGVFRAIPGSSGYRVSEVHGDGDAVLLVLDAKKAPTRVVRTTGGGAFDTVLETPDLTWVGDHGVIVTQALSCWDELAKCTPPRVRSADGSWHDIALPAGHRVEKLAVDAARGRLWLVVTHGKLVSLVSAALDGTGVRTTPIRVNGTILALHVSRTGDAMLFVGWGLEKTMEIEIVAVTAAGLTLPARHAPVAANGIVFAGARAFAAGHTIAWESADDGLHWTRVAAPDFFVPKSCSELGCVDDSTLRVGWELELGASGPIAAEPGEPSEPPTAKPSPPSVTKLSCRANGTWTKHPVSFGETEIGLDGETAVAISSQNRPELQGKAMAALVVRGAPQFVTLLPERKRPEGFYIHQDQRVVAGGLIAKRSTVAMSAAQAFEGGSVPVAPVDLQVAWWSAKTGKVHRAELKKQAALRDFREQAILEGGALVKVGDKLFYLAESGAEKSMPMPPPSYRLDSAVQIGDRILLETNTPKHTLFADTRDFGKTWKTTTWSMGGPGRLGVLGGAPVWLGQLARHDSNPPLMPTFLQSIDPLGDDPPDGLKPLGLDGPPATCKDVKNRIRVVSADPARVVEVAYTEEPKTGIAVTFLGDERVLRVDAESACLDVVSPVGNWGKDRARLVIPLRDLSHAWIVREIPDGQIAIRPMSCGS